MRYAQIQNNIVINIVIADSNFVDLHDDDFVLIENQSVEIGSSYENGIFVLPQPYPSWTRDGNSWKAPISLPNDSYNYETSLGVIYMWDESSLSWLPIPDAG
jgi:hypothetical protein